MTFDLVLAQITSISCDSVTACPREVKSWMGDRPVLPHAIHAEVWKAITFVSILYSFGLEVLSCGVVLSLCGEVWSLCDEV